MLGDFTADSMTQTIQIDDAGGLSGIVVQAIPTLGDVNRDGIVNFFDISPFADVLSADAFQAEADVDGNGVVDFFDIAPFIELLSPIAG